MDVKTAQSVVLDVLTKAASQDAEILKPAEKQLKEWETQPGFYSVLFAIFADYNVDVNVRWIAILYFKNGIDRYWRKTAPNVISESERAALRPLLISNFNEPVSQLATQLAVLISKVARFDCPKDWPELFPTLMNAVKSQHDLEQQRALLTLHHVTKALSSKRLAGDRRLFQDLTNNIFEFILQLWFFHDEQMIHSMQTYDNKFVVFMEKSTLALKTLHRLTVHGFKKPDKNCDCVKFLSSLFDKLRSYLELRKNFVKVNLEMCEKTEKYIVLMTKILINVLEYHPFSYIPFIRPSLEFAVTYVFTSAGAELLFERFVVQCMNLIKGILLCAEYRPAKIMDETKNPQTLEAHAIREEFFTEQVLLEISRRLLTSYFLLSEDNLNTWENDPEDFAVDEGGESWKYNSRPSTEALFLSLYHEFRQQLTSTLLCLMTETAPMCDPADLPAILRKEAIYNAVGLAAFELYDEVDFDQWFLNTLLKELEVSSPSYKIIRRRVISLIGQWISVKLSHELRPCLYKSILPLLNVQEDLAVRLAAANTLKIAVDDFEFGIEQFLPYLESSFNLLFELLNQVSGCDTKMQVLYVMSFVIERVGNQIRPYASSLVQYLPLLWNKSEDHNMLRCAIITTLVHLVQSLGSQSADLYSFLIPVIHYSVDITKDPHVYLLVDGLDLWWAVLDNAVQVTSDLCILFQQMPSLLEYTSDSLLTCLNIIQAQALLDPNEFVRNNSEAIAQSCASIFSDLKSEGIINVLSAVEEIIRVLPSEGPRIFKPLLPKIFISVLRCDEYPMVMSSYLAILGRIVLQNAAVFYELQEFIAAEQHLKADDVFGSLLDVWIDRLSVVTQIERRKLLGLASASFIINGSPVVLHKMCGLLLACVEVLHDVMHLDNSGIEMDSLIRNESDNVPESDLETEHDKRKRASAFKDPIHSIVLKDFLQAKLDQLQRNIGQSNFKVVMDTVDVETMQQLVQFVKPF